MAAAIPVWAQQSRIYRDGTSWVEEISGTLPATRQVRIITDLGSVQVQGNSPTRDVRHSQTLIRSQRGSGAAAI